MLRQRLDENLPITPVSFNLSRYDFDMLDIFDLVETTRRKYAVPRDFLHVEITESVLAQDSRVIQQALTHLRQEGYEIWLDDFGSVATRVHLLVRTPAVGYIIILSLEEVLHPHNPRIRLESR